MTPLVPITMFGWIPVVVGLFARLKPRHAVITAFLAAWLFLPIAKYPLPGLPDYTKMSATCWGIFFAAFMFDSQRLLSFKPRLYDFPMVIWCICPLFTSLSNGLGIYDGLATVLRYTVTWGFPFLIGRIYFSDLEGLREFAIGILVGGLLYIPFCLFETRMSPQLHYWLYGFHQHSFAQSYRWGGWRPMVFMDHGLMVGVWIMSASMICFWFWMTGALKKLFQIPMAWLASALLFTSAMVRSTGAWALLLMGFCVLFTTKKFKHSIIIICLSTVPIFYIGTRATGTWSGYDLQEFIATHISVERALSLWTRMENENILVEKASERPLFGWGGWGRSRVYDEEGKDITITDGLWIIVLGQNGMMGLAALTLAVLLPIFVFIRYYPAHQWEHPQVAPAMVLATLMGLYMIDNLLNAMINPIFMVVAGGLTGLQKENIQNPASLVSTENVSERDSVSHPRFL